MLMVEKLGRELISPSADRFWRMKSLDKVVTDRFDRLNDTITRLFRDARRWKTSTKLLEIPKLDRTSLARDKYARSPRSVSADRFLPNRRKRTIVVDIMYLHTSKTLKRYLDEPESPESIKQGSQKFFRMVLDRAGCYSSLMTFRK